MWMFGTFGFAIVICCFLATLYFVFAADASGRTKLFVMILYVFAWAFDCFDHFILNDRVPLMVGFLINIILCIFYVFHFKYVA